MNLSLKHKLMLQSLSPLAFLTIVRNFKFTPVSELAENQSYWGEFVRLNNVLIVVFLLCATWILAAIISFISFTAFRWTDKKQTLAGMVNSYMHIQFFRFLCHNFQSISSWRRQPQGSDFSIMKHPGKWIPVPDRIQDLQERQIRFYPHRH